MISKHLRRLVENKTVNARDVEVILKRAFHSGTAARRRQCLTLFLCSQKAILKYNPKYKDQWSFDALTEFVKVHVSWGQSKRQTLGTVNMDLTEEPTLFSMAWKRTWT